MLEPLLDTKAAAGYLGYHPNTLEQWRVKGAGPRYRKIGKHIRYTPDDLRAFVDSATCGSTSEAA